MATPFIRTNGPGFNQQFGTVSGGIATLQPSDSATDYTISFQAANQTVPIGTCSANQVLVGSGTNTHASSPNFTFDGTTLYANAKLNLGAVTNASPVDGDLWYDTTKKTFACGVNGATSYITLQASDQTVPVGTCSANQVLVGSGTNTYASSPNFTFDGTTLYANAKLKLGAVTNASPVDGDLWYDTTKKTFASGFNGVASYLSGVIFTQTASKTIENTLNAEPIFVEGIGSTALPRNFFTAGRSIRMRAYGYISTGAAAPSVSLFVRVGAIDLSSTGTLPAGLSNALVEFDFTCSCRRVVGAVAGVIGQGSLKITPSAAFASSVGMPIVMTDETSMNATLDLYMNVRYKWGTASASNTITFTNAIIEVLA